MLFNIRYDFRRRRSRAHNLSASADKLYVRESEGVIGAMLFWTALESK